MSKVQGSYASVVRGVSQQAPADRLEGQHGEVLNMLSDPVRGLVRRNGMILEAQQTSLVSGSTDNGLTDSFSYRVFPYQDQGAQLDILYRSRPRVGAVSSAHLDTLVVFNKTSNAFVPVVRNPADTALDTWDAQGISAITSIGSYVLLASNGVAPSYTTEAGIDNTAWRNCAAAWVRGGAYGRTYTAKATRASDSAAFSVTYTTPLAQYPGVFSIMGAVPLGAIGSPFEQYFINIAQAAYDTAVNQWIATSSAAIVPSAIATQLRDALTNAGFAGWSVFGSHLVSDNCSYVEVSDGGNGEFLRAVLTDVQSADDLTDVHRVGKVVRVQPKDSSSEAYYLKAYPAVSGSAEAFQEVIWREAAGTIQRPATVLAMGRLYSGTFYWASSPTALQALIPAAGTPPSYADSTAGDTTSVSPPAFYGRAITMLGVFQDRLMIGSGGVVNLSERGDYLNFYRTTMLTIPASDPVEMFALGTEGDTIRKCALYDRNMTLYGDKFHYVISGRTAIDAANPSMSVQFAMAGSAYAQPIGTGPFVFVLKEDSQLAASRLLQIQAGVYQDTPALTDASQQLRDYINGTPAELVALTSPACIFVRTEHFLKSQGGFPRARPWGLYLYQYLDSPGGERIVDAWSAWEWSNALGTPIGISSTETGDGILLYTLAFGTDQAGLGAKSILVQKASARPDPTGLPYLDGLQVATAAAATGLWTTAAQASVTASVYTSPSAARSYSAVPATTDAARFIGLEHPHYTVGDGPAESLDPFRWTGVQGWRATYITAYPTAPTDTLWTGLAFPAFVDLTNPFIRDRDGKANVLGRLNLTKLKVSTTRSAGLAASWIDHSGTKTVLNSSGTYSRIKYDHLVWVGRDTRDVQVRLSAVTWQPLTINSIQWQGNWFSNARRVG